MEKVKKASDKTEDISDKEKSDADTELSDTRECCLMVTVSVLVTVAAVFAGTMVYYLFFQS